MGKSNEDGQKNDDIYGKESERGRTRQLKEIDKTWRISRQDK